MLLMSIPVPLEGDTDELIDDEHGAAEDAPFVDERAAEGVEVVIVNNLDIATSSRGPRSMTFR